MRGNNKYEIKQILDKDNRIITNEEDIMERWKEYFHELLTSTQITENTKETQCDMQSKTTEEGDIKIPEVINAIKIAKRGKSAGHDKINAEMLKLLGEHGIQALTVLLNKTWDTGVIPNDWKIGIIIPIYKNKGDSRNCINYRGITLMSIVGKIYESILDKRLRDIVEPQLEDEQSGFRKGCSAQDLTFTIQQMLEKKITANQQLYAAFIDMEKRLV